MIDVDVRYAESLIKAADMENALFEVAGDMRSLAVAFSQCANLFKAPIFPVREQLAVVNDVLGGRLHPLSMRFISLLAEMRRVGDIEHIASLFEHLANKAMKKTELYITVFDEASEPLKTNMVEAAVGKGLIKPDSAERLIIKYTIDKSILGGFIMECDGFSWDCSLRTRLNAASGAVRKMAIVDS
jgi:F-type H+-transporting ATPase subunit delta